MKATSEVRTHYDSNSRCYLQNAFPSSANTAASFALHLTLGGNLNLLRGNCWNRNLWLYHGIHVLLLYSSTMFWVIRRRRRRHHQQIVRFVCGRRWHGVYLFLLLRRVDCFPRKRHRLSILLHIMGHSTLRRYWCQCDVAYPWPRLALPLVPVRYIIIFWQNGDVYVYAYNNVVMLSARISLRVKGHTYIYCALGTGAAWEGEGTLNTTCIQCSYMYIDRYIYI